MARFNFNKAFFTSNLGGTGPDFNFPEEVRFFSVGTTHDGIEFDMIAKVTNSDYEPATFNVAKKGSSWSYNGVVKKMARIGVLGGSTAELTFTFVEKGTNIEVVLPAFYI